MKRLNVAVAAVVAACVMFVAACGGSSPAADEAAIRDINKKWLELIVAKDAKAIAALYAEDGALLPPNAPKAQGREAIEKAWADFMALPGMTLTFETEKLVLAKSGDVGVDVGTYKSSVGEGAAAVADTGKSVVTWVKRDGQWLVLTDMFSSDMPAAAPAPAAPPAETMPAPEGTTPAPEGTTPAPEGTTEPAPAQPTPGTP